MGGSCAGAPRDLTLVLEPGSRAAASLQALGAPRRRPAERVKVWVGPGCSSARPGSWPPGPLTASPLVPAKYSRFQRAVFVPWPGAFRKTGGGGKQAAEALPPKFSPQALLGEKAPRFPFMGNPQIWALTQSPGSRKQVWRAAEPCRSWSSCQTLSPGPVGLLKTQAVRSEEGPCPLPPNQEPSALGQGPDRSCPTKGQLPVPRGEKLGWEAGERPSRPPSGWKRYTCSLMPRSGSGPAGSRGSAPAPWPEPRLCRPVGGEWGAPKPPPPDRDPFLSPIRLL